MPLLDKAYANALLFSVGLLLGSTGDPADKDGASKAPPQPVPAAPPGRLTDTRADTARVGAESEELATLRRAEREMFGELDDLTDELAGAAREVAEACGDRGARDRERAVPRTQLGRRDAEFWSDLRMPALPVQQNARVEKYIRYFTESKAGRKIFVSWLKRSGRYRDVLLKELSDQGLPPDLIAVTFIESGMRPTAVSKAGATGLWQFMARTGRAYGLKVGRRYDERRSIWRSTEAASRHLADLHSYFRNWDLALAAYNYGYERLANLSGRMGTKDFWSLSAIDDALPRETVLYVPKVLAVAVILNNLERFELDRVELDAPLEAAAVEVPGGARLSLLARAAGTSLERIRELNPEITNDRAPHRREAVTLHIPADGLARARVLLPRLLESPDRKDDDVPAGFDWGRDDARDDVLTRLAETATTKTPSNEDWGGGETPSRGASSYFAVDRPRSNAHDTQRDDRAPPTGKPPPDKPPGDGFSATTKRSGTTSSTTQVIASGARTTCERPADDHAARMEAPEAPVTRKTAPTPRAARAEPPRVGKRRVSPRRDRRTIYYIASATDSAASIARVFGVSERELLQANELRSAEQVKGGLLLKVPVPQQSFERLANEHGPSRR